MKPYVQLPHPIKGVNTDMQGNPIHSNPAGEDYKKLFLQSDERATRLEAKLVDLRLLMGIFTESTLKKIISYLEQLDEDNVEDRTVGIFMDKELKELIKYLKEAPTPQTGRTYTEGEVTGFAEWVDKQTAFYDEIEDNWYIDFDESGDRKTTKQLLDEYLKQNQKP